MIGMRYLEVSNISDGGIPYARLIVSGKKTWEIRWHNTRYRGTVAIIFDKKILGTAKLVDVFSATPKELAKHKNHMSTYKRMRKYAAKKKVRKLHAWILSDARRFNRPKKIRYKFVNNYSWSVPVR